MNFSSQQHAIDFFEKSVAKDKISHAYLLSGEQFTGKEYVAYKFARLLICGKLDCGGCDSCRSFDFRTHPDFIEIKKNGEEIGVSEIRDLKNQFVSKPLLSQKKIAIIFDSDYLSKEAQNSSLKLLEECPSYGIIILVCQNENNLLKTIISRSISVNLQSSPFSEMEKNFGNQIANFSLGRVAFAEKMKSDKNFSNDFLDSFAKLQKANSASDFGRLSYAEDLCKDARKIDQMLKYWQIFLRSQIMDRVNIDVAYKFAVKDIGDKKTSELVSAMKKVIDAGLLLKNTSVNKQLVLENLMLNI